MVDYEHNKLYVYDGTSQTFDPIVDPPPSDIDLAKRCVIVAAFAVDEQSRQLLYAVARHLQHPKERLPSGLEPLYYVKWQTIFQRPVKNEGRGTTMGFAVCEVRDGVDPEEVCAIMNRGEPATEG